MGVWGIWVPKSKFEKPNENKQKIVYKIDFSVLHGPSFLYYNLII